MAESGTGTRASLVKGTALALLVLATAGQGAIVAHWWLEVSTLRRHHAKLESRVVDRRAMVAHIDKIKREREAIESDLEEYRKRMPGEPDVERTLETVRRLASRLRVTVEANRRLAARSKPSHAEQPVEISLAGQQGAVVTFIQELVRLDRLVTLDRLRLAWPEEGPAAARAHAADPSRPIQASVVAVLHHDVGPAIPSR